MLISALVGFAQTTANDVMLLKNPNTDKWGYASKNQNRKSPIRGLRKTAIKVLGKTGQDILASGYVNNIDWVVPAQYDAAATNFEENLAAVEIDGKVGFIDLNNRFIIEPRFEPMKHLGGFSQGLAAVKIGDKYGYVNKRGQVVIQPQFEYAKNFRDNLLASVKMDGKYGAIDITGTLVVPCKYVVEEAMTTVPISNKEYRAAVKDAQTKRDNDVYAKVTDPIQAASREVNKRINDSTWYQKLTFQTVTNDNGKKGIRDNYGRTIVPSIYTDCRYDAANHLYIVQYTDFNDEKCYGVYSEKGDYLFHPLFDNIGAFSKGRAQVTVAGVSGWIDTDGFVQPELLDKLCDTGLNYDASGDKRQARKVYNRILDIDPNHVMALNNLALMDIDIKDYNKGMRNLKLAHELAPDNKLIADNLKMAKNDRKERRWNRLNSTLSVFVAVVGMAGAGYAASTGGTEGLQAANNIMKSTTETVAAINGEEAPTTVGEVGMPTTGAFDATAYDASGYDDGTNTGNNASNKKKNTSMPPAKKAKQVDHVAIKNLDRAYSGWDDQLINMQLYPERYSKQDFDDVPSIQRKMRDIREKIKKMGGYTKPASPRETWVPKVRK